MALEKDCKIVGYFGLLAKSRGRRPAIECRSLPCVWTVAWGKYIGLACFRGDILNSQFSQFSHWFKRVLSESEDLTEVYKILG